MSDSEELPGHLPHKGLVEWFENVWCVTGKMIVTMGATPLPISRNMTVIREGGDLTLVNTMRLDDAGLAALATLGTVRHIVKLGSYHGRDDAFYARRHPDATVWAPPGMPHDHGVATDRELADGQTPVSDASTFIYETPSNIEAILHLAREGGILIPCDSLQNCEEPDEYFDEVSRKGMAKFFGRARIGFGWLNFAKPEASDFTRLAELEFAHLLPAHGAPLIGAAGDAIRASIAEAFPDASSTQP